MAQTAYLCAPDRVTPIKGRNHQILYKGEIFTPNALGQRIGISHTAIQTRIRHYAAGRYTYGDVIFKGPIKPKPKKAETPKLPEGEFVTNEFGVSVLRSKKSLTIIAIGDWIISKYDVSVVSGIDLPAASSRVGKYKRGMIDCDGLFSPHGFFSRQNPGCKRKAGERRQAESYGNAEWAAMSDKPRDENLRHINKRIGSTALDDKYGVGPTDKGAAYLSIKGAV